MSTNDPPATEDHYHVVHHNGLHSQAPIVIQHITSEDGHEIKMKTIRSKDDKWTTIANASYNNNKIQPCLTYLSMDIDRSN
jgi:hypothetical protein